MDIFDKIAVVRHHDKLTNKIYGGYIQIKIPWTYFHGDVLFIYV